MSNKLLVVIAGPTSSGKTDMAIQLAQKLGTEIVNADSRQVYKELNIGVGKPTEEQLSLVPHHMISHVSISEHYSAGHYTTDALHIIYTLFAKHNVVILSGGTGLYIKSIIEGFDEIPHIPEEINQKWTTLLKEQGLEPLVNALREMDPDYYAQVDLSNPSRLIRAVSVSDHTGKPFSSFRMGAAADRPFKVLPIVIDLSRSELYERINARVISMIDDGWLDETRALLPYREHKALLTVGYKELFEVLDGKITLEDAIPVIQQSTRRYAKRQMTWFRNQGDWIRVEKVEDIQGYLLQKGALDTQ